MAKKNLDRIDPTIFIKQIENNTVEQYFAALLKRGEGTSIDPSIGAKVIKDEQGEEKIVLMDLLQHEEECRELVSKGIVPLRQGYIFIDEDAYNELKRRGLISNPDSDFVTSKSKFKTRVSVSEKAFVDETEEIINARKNDPFLENKNWSSKNYHQIAMGDRNSTKDHALEQLEIFRAVKKPYIKISKGKVTINRPLLVYVYFTSTNRFKPANNSKLYIFGWTNYDSFMEDKEPSFTEEYDSILLDTEVKFDLSDKQAAGHLQSFKTSITADLIEALKVLKKEQILINHPKYKEYLTKINIMIVVLKNDLAELKRIDRAFGSPASYFNKDFSEYLQNIVSGAKQVGKNIIFSYTEGKELKEEKGSAFLSLLYEIRGISTFESIRINSGAKAGYTRAVSNRINKAWQRASDLYLKKLARANLKKKIGEQTSHSMLQALIINALGTIFDDRIKNKINLRRKNRQSFSFLKQAYSKVKSVPFTAFRKQKAVFKLKKQISNKKQILSTTQQTTQNIVPLINAEIYKYVRAEMSDKSLRYRTGEFARSVRVLSAQENAAVQYTYEKSPYSDVFSPGKSYLATENRNPAKIIDRAINKLGRDRFQKVFRTEEV